MDRQGARQSKDMLCGFTLMELLVVISIICLLMSITLPSLTRAREQGKRVMCLSNMRSLTQCWLMYALENDDRLCSADTGWDVPPDCHWVADGPVMPGNEIGGTAEAIMAGILWPYTGETLGLYKCKSDITEQLRSYAISRAMNGQGYGHESNNIRPFRGWSEVTRASERLVFIDGACRTLWMEGSFCAVREMDAAAPEWFVSNSRNISAPQRRMQYLVGGWSLRILEISGPADDPAGRVRNRSGGCLRVQSGPGTYGPVAGGQARIADAFGDPWRVYTAIRVTSYAA